MQCEIQNAQRISNIRLTSGYAVFPKGPADYSFEGASVIDDTNHRNKFCGAVEGVLQGDND